ncbi:MAG TPA: sugar kinase [Vicinamibacterales bacterium]|nr:sugar kinase [Vicinamibacterales bacterium]
MIDLVTFGEAMVRLTPPSFQRLEQARSLDLHVGGAELNVAVGASRLGVPARWVSRLTESPLGRLIAGRARAENVDVSRVQWTRGDRVGLYFVEPGAAPRASSVLYDRDGSAISRVQPGTIDWKDVFDGARWFHVSGITPALGKSAALVTAEALEAAVAAGLTVSYDLNFRSKLWSAEEARRVQEPLMRYVDVLIATEEDARVVLGAEAGHSTVGYTSVDAASYAPVAESLQKRFDFTAVAITLRENPRVWLNTWSALLWADSRAFEGPRYEVEVVDRIGAGDAFSAGLIFGRLAIGDWESALRYGTALSALKHTTPGDFSASTRDEVERLLASGDLRVAR